MKQNKTHLLFIIDRSGSMSVMHSDLIGGINNLISEQKKQNGECDVSIVSFDDVSEDVFWTKSLKDVRSFDVKKDFLPRGSTALLDAMGYSIDKLGELLSQTNEEERPEKVLVTIYTDGFENASRKFTRSQVANKVKHQTDIYKWGFVFLGSNQDAVLTASTLNISENSSLTYNCTSTGNFYAFSGLSSYITGVRGPQGTLGTSFSQQIRTLSMSQ